MPIYEYRCKECGEEFEKIVRSGTEINCPECSSDQVRRMMSAFAFKSGDSFVPSSGGSGCGSCSASTCSGCSK